MHDALAAATFAWNYRLRRHYLARRVQIVQRTVSPMSHRVLDSAETNRRRGLNKIYISFDTISRWLPIGIRSVIKGQFIYYIEQLFHDQVSESGTVIALYNYDEYNCR